jgi:hypothetical protein
MGWENRDEARSPLIMVRNELTPLALDTQERRFIGWCWWEKVDECDDHEFVHSIRVLSFHLQTPPSSIDHVLDL